MKLGKKWMWIAPLVVVLIGGTVATVSHYKKTSDASVAGTQQASSKPKANDPKPAPTTLVASNPNAKKVDLSAYNAKEKQLTDEAVKIYQEINSKYDQVQKGTLSTKDFKKQMEPLCTQMKTNFDEYKKFTDANGVSYADHNSDTFKKGVALASSIRLDEYTFLLNVTARSLTKQQIADSYKQNLSTFESRLKQYQDMTKSLS